MLATGARVRKLPVPGVLYLHDRDDAIELKARLESAGTVAIVGGGFIGLEVAAAARAMGRSVTLVEAQDRLMARCVAPVVSEFFRDTHVAEGVTVILNSSEIPHADLIVAGIGVLANVELAHSAGLTVRNGIVVDAFLKTVDPNIFAIGDCAEAGNGMRLESVQNAADQAKSVAAQIVHGRRRIARCRGSGRTSSISSCKWRGFRLRATKWYCAGPWNRGNSRRSISMTRTGWQRSIQLIVRATILWHVRCWRLARL